MKRNKKIQQNNCKIIRLVFFSKFAVFYPVSTDISPHTIHNNLFSSIFVKKHIFLVPNFAKLGKNKFRFDKWLKILVKNNKKKQKHRFYNSQWYELSPKSIYLDSNFSLYNIRIDKYKFFFY